MNTAGSQAKIKFYQGKEGVLSVMQEARKQEGETLTYTNLGLMLDLFPDEMTRFRQERGKSNLKTRTISTYSQRAKKYIESQDLFTGEQILFVNKQEFIFENDVIVYGDKVAIISLQENEKYGFIVESPAFAKTQRTIFDLSWLGGNMFITN